MCRNTGNNIFATYDTAQFQITDFPRFGSVRLDMITVLSIVWPQSLLWCPFHKKLSI